jgi:REP element-mobilizing transposase RayT
MSLKRISVEIPSSVYFVTTSTINHERLFESCRVLWKLHGILANLVVKYDANLYAYVFMLTHVHLLLRLPGSVHSLSTFMRDFKSLSARQIFPDRHGIWMPRFDDVTIVTEKQFFTKLNYIHQNPVRAGLVAEACAYRFSSASAWDGHHVASLVEIDLTK